MKNRTGARTGMLAGALLAGSLGSSAPVLAASDEVALEAEITTQASVPGSQIVEVESNIALTGVLPNVQDRLDLFSGVSLTGSAGGAGAGHAGGAGDAGDAGSPVLTFSGADASLSTEVSSVIEGGAGGAGRSLTAADAQSLTSTTFGIDGTAALAGQAGIAAGDSFDISIDGSTDTITINAGETFADIAAEIEAFAGPGFSATATTTGTNDTLTISQAGAVIETLTWTNNNNTPLTALGFQDPFPYTLSPLFENGGAGGDGAGAVVLGTGTNGTFDNPGTIRGGTGGDGGSTIARDGIGGAGGKGATAATLAIDSTATLQNTGTISGGAGGAGGAGGIDGTDGAHGLGGTGVLMAGTGQTLINGGLIQGGLDGGGSVRANAVEIIGDNNLLELHTGFSFTGDVVSAGIGNTLALGGAAAGVFDLNMIGSDFVGFDALGKSGASTWTLTGDASTYSGTTTISDGTLVIDGALGGTLDLNGGTLGGSGTVAGLTVNSGATLAPGNSIGTMNATNTIFNAGSIYEVELDDGGFVAGTNNDLLDDSGTVTINGGTVHVTPENGTDDGSTYMVPGTYTIITSANPLAGTGFDSVTDDFAFLSFALTHGANDVLLNSSLSATSFCLAGMSANACATGDGAFSLGGGSLFSTVLMLSNAEAPIALDQLSGELHASAQTALLEDSRFPREATMDRLRAALGGVAVDNSGQIEDRVSENAGLWAQGFGSWRQWDNDGNAAAMDRTIGGFLMGGDALVMDNARFGVLGGYSRSSFSVPGRMSSGTADSYTLGAYGGGEWDAFTLTGGLAHSWHGLETSRSVAFTGFTDNLSASYSARTLQAWGEAAYSFEAGAARFEPFANLAYVNLNTDGFTETGGPAALTAAPNVVDATFTTLGLRAETDISLGDMDATLRGMVGWRHAFGGAPASQMSFSGGNAFTIAGVPLGQDSLVLDAGFDVNLTDNAVLGLTYGGQFGSGIQDHSAKASLNVRF